jgi:sensor histidine kinase YesM
MAKIQQTLSKAGSGNAGYFWITLLAGVLILLGVHDYFHTYNPSRDEALSIFSTIFFLCGVYTGRYIAMLWTNKGKEISNSLLIRQGITVLVAGILLVIAAQFILAIGKPSLGILLIGLPGLVLSISLGMLIKMMRSSIRGQLQDARSSAEQSQSELKLLQSQLSPHFLFNTLNNIYGISLSQHEKVPTLLLKLSALLRYSVYDAKEEYVPLRDEMEYRV